MYTHPTTALQHAKQQEITNLDGGQDLDVLFKHRARSGNLLMPQLELQGNNV
jgi:hypothetical protein